MNLGSQLISLTYLDRTQKTIVSTIWLAMIIDMIIVPHVLMYELINFYLSASDNSSNTITFSTKYVETI